ncbi:DUF6044 family protein [Hymenobacter sp. BT730]|uniref:DUF6044 family protein n=1 Tax=Hymenobacter sp. BT730 TaxID=3063332 RepID=UPI0026E0AB3A|nr:DUF6044 family protein [Hymenobacter sp. BT730]
MLKIIMLVRRQTSSPLLLALLGLLLLLIPFLLAGSHSYLLIDDNLDAELSVPYLLTRTGTALRYGASTVIPQVMNGLPRNALRPGLSVTVLLFELLPPLPAYLINMALVRLAGLLSMYALLRCWLLPGQDQRKLAAGVALAWALLPIYSIYGVSVLGQPAVVLAVRELRRQHKSLWPWLVLLAFPFWSTMVLAGLFILVGVGAWLLWADWRSRQVSWLAWIGLGLLVISYAVVEYPLLSALWQHQFVPHRLEFDFAKLAPSTFLGQVRSTLQQFLMGQYHSSLFFRGVILMTVLLVGWRSYRRTALFPWRTVIVILLLLAMLAAFCGFYPAFLALVQPLLPPLRTFNLTRFSFLTPLLWFVMWVIALRALPAGRSRAALVALQLLLGLAMNREWTLTARELLGRPAPHEPSYQRFVAPALFAQVQQDIRVHTGQVPAQYRVACLGLPPSVVQLNGFYTLDSYQNNYPLPYKHAFRPIIAGELAKSPMLRAYFDAWGNRCYLFAAELGKNFRIGAGQHAPIQHFAFNAKAFQRLGGRYVLSAVALAHPGQTGLRLQGEYSNQEAYWHLYVYEVAP